MKKIIYILVFVAGMFMSEHATAQLRTSYFMEGSYFRTDLNPALAPTRGYLSLPFIGGIGLNMPNNFLSVDNFVYKKGDELVTALHGSVSSDEFLGRLPEVCRLGMNLNAQIFGVGFHVKRMYWNFGVKLRSTSDITLSRDVFKVLKTFGNGVYDLGKSGINSNSYLEAYLGTSIPIGKHVNVGVRLKALVGLLNISTDIEKMQATVGSESINAQLKGVIRANTFVIDRSKVTPGEFNMDFLTTDLNYMINNIKSLGLAVDLGAEVRLLDDHLKISAAVTDLGFIKWQANTTYQAEASANFEFKGMNLTTGEADLVTDFSVSNTQPVDNGYTTMVNASLNVGVEYNFLRNHFAVGLLSHTEFYNTSASSELTASFNIRATNWLSATLSHTFLSRNKLGVLGFALNIHPSVINIFLGVDYVGLKMGRYGSIPVPISQKSINLYAGVGFNFGRPKYVREQEREMRVAHKEAKLAKRANKVDNIKRQ